MLPPRASRNAGAAPGSAPQRAARVRLKEGMSVADALSATLAACTRHIRANIAGAKRGRDPECLHQLRVGIRRLRAALSVYRGAMPAEERRAIGRDFRRLEHGLGPARDWDVLIGQLEQSKGGQDRPKFARLIDLAKARGASAYQRLAQAIDRPAISSMLMRARHLARLSRDQSAAQGCIRDFAIEVLDERDRRARKMGRHIRSLGPLQLHRLRICVKKLRYASEFFIELWPKAATRAYVDALKLLQDELGHMQDATNAARLVAGIREKGKDGLRPAVRHAQKRVKAFRKRARRGIVRCCRDFKAAPRFWRQSCPHPVTRSSRGARTSASDRRK